MQQEINPEFVKGLQKLWHAENLLVQAMPAMIENATAIGLKKNLALHWAETDEQKSALQAMCRMLGVNHTGGSDGELEGMLQQGEQEMMTAAPGTQMDAAIAASARQIEAWEIAQYPPIAKLAEASGFEGMARRLWQSFEEERQADTKLQFLEDHVIPYGNMGKEDATGRTGKHHKE